MLREDSNISFWTTRRQWKAIRLQSRNKPIRWLADRWLRTRSQPAKVHRPQKQLHNVACSTNGLQSERTSSRSVQPTAKPVRPPTSTNASKRLSELKTKQAAAVDIFPEYEQCARRDIYDTLKPNWGSTAILLNYAESVSFRNIQHWSVFRSVEQPKTIRNIQA